MSKALLRMQRRVAAENATAKELFNLRAERDSLKAQRDALYEALQNASCWVPHLLDHDTLQDSANCDHCKIQKLLLEAGEHLKIKMLLAKAGQP